MIGLVLRLNSDRRGMSPIAYAVGCMIAVGVVTFAGKQLTAELSRQVGAMTAQMLSGPTSALAVSPDLNAQSGCRVFGGGGGCPVRIADSPIGIPGVASQNRHSTPVFVVSGRP